MAPQPIARDNRDLSGIYISWPFCAQKCTYCNFASGVQPRGLEHRYLAALTCELESVTDADTLYIGGGTPSAMDPADVEALAARLPDVWREATVEAAPGTLTSDRIRAWKHAGINRVSLGVQSFIDREAQSSGRLHSRAIVEDDLRRLRAAGIRNINLDLIAGLAGQTFASWQESLDALIGAGVPHASVYMLEVDEDSRLGREMLAGGVRYHAELVPNDDAIARMYSEAIDSLATAGLAQYEISNFCQPGFASRHNLRYWQRRPYLGLGLDASSMLRAPRSGPGDLPNVLRATTADDLTAYLEASQPLETAWHSPASQLEEAWFLGLRLNAGVSVADLESEFGRAAVAPALEVVSRLAEEGLLLSEGGVVRLTARGQLLSNDVFQEFLGLANVAELVPQQMRS